MTVDILTAVGTFTGVTLIVAILLIFLANYFSVKEDHRLDIVEEMLPNSNCGACGYVGCRQFAQALLQAETNPGKCTVSDATQRENIANFLQVDVGEISHLVARLACAGGNNVSRFRANYSGQTSCRAAALLSGGPKICHWGCLGLGDCEQVCDFDAITMNPFDLPVVSEQRCTACGDCVTICPKDLFSIHPTDHRLWVACNNLEFGDDILSYCEVGCTACARCAKDSEDDLVTMQSNLAVVNFEKNHHSKSPIQRCPTGAIVWLNPDGSIEFGEQSKKVLRKKPLSALTS